MFCISEIYRIKSPPMKCMIYLANMVRYDKSECKYFRCISFFHVVEVNRLIIGISTVETHQKPEEQRSLSMKIYSMRKMPATICLDSTCVIDIWLYYTINRTKPLNDWMLTRNKKSSTTSKPNIILAPMI